MVDRRFIAGPFSSEVVYFRLLRIRRDYPNRLRSMANNLCVDRRNFQYCIQATPKVGLDVSLPRGIFFTGQTAPPESVSGHALL